MPPDGIGDLRVSYVPLQLQHFAQFTEDRHPASNLFLIPLEMDLVAPQHDVNADRIPYAAEVLIAARRV